MKSKSEEIAILTAAARQLGEHSYCGPWLYSIITEIEDSIKSDLLPAVSWIESRAEDEAQRSATQADKRDREEAAQVLRDAQHAQAKAAAAVTRAKDDINDMKNQLQKLSFHL